MHRFLRSCGLITLLLACETSTVDEQDAARAIDAAVDASSARRDASDDTVDATTSPRDAGPDAGPQPPPPGRVVFVYTPHGIRRADWATSTPGQPVAFGPALRPLEPFASRTTLLDGLDGVRYERTLHHDCSGCVLATSALPYTGGQNYGIPGGSGSTFDVVLGRSFGTETFRPMVPLAIGSPNFGRLPRSFERGQPIPPTVHPDEAYDRLFASIGDPAVCSAYQRPASLPRMMSWSDYPAVARAMEDITVAALACDLTRVVTLDFRHDYGLVMSWLGQAHNYVQNTHDEGVSTQAREEHVRSWQWFAGEVANLAARLYAVPAGDGTLLDHTLIVWLTDVGLSGPMQHSNNDLAVVLIGNLGGRLVTGRHLGVDGPIAQLSVTIAASLGIDDQTLGEGYVGVTPLSELMR